MSWSHDLIRYKEDVYLGLKGEIEKEVQDLREKGWWGSDAKSSLVLKYSNFYREYFEIKIKERLVITSLFHDRVCLELTTDGQSLKNDEDIDYFFELKYDNFITKLKDEYEYHKSLRSDFHGISDKDYVLGYKREDVVKYVGTLIGRWEASEFARCIAFGKRELNEEKQDNSNNDLIEGFSEEHTFTRRQAAIIIYYNNVDFHKGNKERIAEKYNINDSQKLLRVYMDFLKYRDQFNFTNKELLSLESDYFFCKRFIKSENEKFENDLKKIREQLSYSDEK